MNMINCKMKQDDGPKACDTSSEEKVDMYPEISFGDEPSWGTIPIEDGNLSVDDKVVVKLICKVKSSTERKENKPGGKSEKTFSGTFEVLEAGVAPYDEKEMRKMDRKSVESKIDETLGE